MLLSVYLFQILNIGYFTAYGKNYIKVGLIFMVVQTLGLFFLYVHYSTKKKESRAELAD